MVYIAEAHALDGPMPNVRSGSPIIEEPETLEERLDLAGQCVTALSIAQIPALVDTIENPALQAYAAFPDRLFLVGEDGKVAFAGDKGPRGFDPDKLEAAIRKELELDATKKDESE